MVQTVGLEPTTGNPTFALLRSIRLSYVCMRGVPRHIPLWRRGGSLVLLWRWVTPFSRQPRRFSRCPKWAGLGGGPLCHVMILAREPQRAAVLGRRGFEPQFSDRVTSINLYATRPKGVLVFPSRQIFSVPRFCQQITGAITTSRLEGLTSGLRITHTAVPLYARHSRCPRRIGSIGGDRTHDLLITSELLCQLSYDTGSPPCLRPGGRADVRRRGLRHHDRVPARIALGTPEEWM